MSKPNLSSIHDPAAYRKRCEPRDPEVANKAMMDFYEDLYELANKHGIADAMVSINLSVRIAPDPLNPDSGGETFLSSCIHIGSADQALEMAAYAHAFHREALETRLSHVKVAAAKRARG